MIETLKEMIETLKEMIETLKEMVVRKIRPNMVHKHIS